jgi:hypothetical protein
MFNLAKFVAKVVWIVCLLALGTLIGVAHGWARHGWQGAIVLGCVGFGVGAFLATSPLAFLQLLGPGI